MGTDQIKYKISGGLKWRSGSESEYIPPQLFMAGFKLVLSTHASLSPVCKAPVSTSALYQPLFVRQAESHTSNNLTSHQFSPSGHVKAVVMERELSASLSFVALISETNIYLFERLAVGHSLCFR